MLLTTHYLDEAEQLADRVAVLRAGEIVAIGTPAELGGPSETEIRYRLDDREVVVSTDEPTRVLHELTTEALAAGRELEDLSVRRANLEEIYLSLTEDDAVNLALHHFRTEQRLYWRSRELAFFTFALPIVFFVLLGSVYGDDQIDGVNGSAYLLAGILGYGVAATAFAGLAIMTVIRREEGVLKRLRGTPLPAWAYLVAVIASTLLVYAVEAVALIVLGRLLFDIPFPDRWLSLVLTLLLGGLAFAALGLGLTGAIRSAEGSSAVVNAIYLPMAFISGSFFSSTAFPPVVEAIAERPAAHVLHRADARRAPEERGDLAERDGRGGDRGLGRSRDDRGASLVPLGAPRPLGRSGEPSCTSTRAGGERDRAGDGKAQEVRLDACATGVAACGGHRGVLGVLPGGLSQPTCRDLPHVGKRSASVTRRHGRGRP